MIFSFNGNRLTLTTRWKFRVFYYRFFMDKKIWKFLFFFYHFKYNTTTYGNNIIRICRISSL